MSETKVYLAALGGVLAGGFSVIAGVSNTTAGMIVSLLIALCGVLLGNAAGRP